MTASRPTIPAAASWSKTSPRRNRSPWVWVLGITVALVLIALPWLFFKVRTELAIRTDAQAARRLIALGKYQEAGAPLERWLKAKPNAAEPHFLAARAAIGLRLFDFGLAGLKKARSLGYPAAAIDRERGIALARARRLTEAEPILRKLLTAGRDRKPDPEADEALAKCYIESFQISAAEEVIKRWIDDAPDDARAYYWKGEIGRRKTDIEQAELIDDFEHALRLDPSHDKARLALGELYLKAHRQEDAAREYTTHLNAHPDDPEACLGLGQIAAERGQDEEAIRLLDRALELAPRDNRSLIERGKLDFRRGKSTSALAFFDKAIEVDATEPEVHYQRSLVLARLGRTPEAKAEQEASVRLRQDKNKLDQLLKDLHRSPNDLQLQFNAARWLFDHGHPEEGLRWTEKILGEHPGHPETNRLLADFYDKQGNRGLANSYRVQAGDQGDRGTEHPSARD
jgi:tetratricopeptide (TPR) repeat protein